MWKLKRNFLRWPPWLGQKELGRENEPECRKKLGRSRSSRFRRGSKEVDLAGAVVCETRGLDIKWPQWYTFIFEGQEKVDMRLVCPQYVRRCFGNRPERLFGKSWQASTEMRSQKKEFSLILLQAYCKEE